METQTLLEYLKLQEVKVEEDQTNGKKFNKLQEIMRNQQQILWMDGNRFPKVDQRKCSISKRNGMRLLGGNNGSGCQKNRQIDLAANYANLFHRQPRDLPKESIALIQDDSDSHIKNPAIETNENLPPRIYNFSGRKSEQATAINKVKHFNGNMGGSHHSTSFEQTSKFTAETIDLTVNSDDLFPFTPVDDPDCVVLGPGGTVVSKNFYGNIDWSLSAAFITRKLTLEIFGHEILLTHSLTGKPSPAFLSLKKPDKKQLDSVKVADIIFIVTSKKCVSVKEVRLAISCKCADEQKLARTRNSK